MPKILILRFSAFGDLVLASPIIRVIKDQLPEAEIHFCTKEKFKVVVASNPSITKVHILEESLGDLVSELKKEKFDYVIDLHNSLRTRIIKFRLGVKSKSLAKNYFQKFLLERLGIDRMPNTHIVERYLEVAALVGVKDDGKGLEYFIPEKDKVNISILPKEYQQGYIAFAIGGQHFTKRLPVLKIVELCRIINAPIVLLGGKEDAFAGDEIIDQLKKDGVSIFNACGQFNLNQSASIVSQARLVFSHDTAMMHIAAAFGKEIYSIWGNTSVAFGMYPFRTKYHVLENNTLNCRPCSKIGYSKCPKGHFKCMLEMDFSAVSSNL